MLESPVFETFPSNLKFQSRRISILAFFVCVSGGGRGSIIEARRSDDSSRPMLPPFSKTSSPSTPEMGGCAFAGTSNKLDNRSAMLCIRVRRCVRALPPPPYVCGR